MSVQLQLALFLNRTSFYFYALVWRLLRFHFEHVPSNYIGVINILIESGHADNTYVFLTAFSQLCLAVDLGFPLVGRLVMRRLGNIRL